MKMKLIALLLVLAALLCGCGESRDTVDEAKPGRMVVALEAEIHPADESLTRRYTDLTQMTSVLTMLQDLDTTEYPAEQPVITGDSEYWTITATYANGGTRVYTLLEEEYLSWDDERFCSVDAAKAASLVSFLEEIEAA